MKKVKFHVNLFILVFILGSCTSISSNDSAESGMVLIPSGSFEMGGRSDQAAADEFPKHQIEVSAFYMDVHEVTNNDFQRFVETTGYVTTAEKDIDWEELKSDVPPGTPISPDSVISAGSLVFRDSDKPVNLNNHWEWWEWTIVANWRRPEGPKSSIENKMDHPVVHISWDDANAYRSGRVRDFHPKRSGSGPLRVVVVILSILGEMSQ